MKRWLLLMCFLVGLGWAIAHFTATQPLGTFQSILIDFKEEIGRGAITTQLQDVAKRYSLNPRLNSEFAEADNLYIVKGGPRILKELQRDLANYVTSVEPNYLYSLPEASQARIPLPVDKKPDVKKSEDNLSEDKKSDSKQGAGKKAEKQPYPNDPLYSRQWNLKALNMEAAWQVTKGKGVKVAVVDTGISRISDLEKTDFEQGYDFINDNLDATDDHGHGTHVAGTIAQSTHNGFGAAGIAPEATLLPVKVLSVGGSGTVADIGEGIRFAADRSAGVILLCVVGDGQSRYLQKAIEYAHRKGSLVIVPAGNSNQNAVPYPARYRYVLAVSALGPDGTKADYSNSGAGVDLAAPGGFIRGEDPSGGIIQNTFDRRLGVSIFAPYQGTSMAAAHVAGVAALVRSQNITDPEQVSRFLIRSSQALPHDPKNDFGAGKLDAIAALTLTKSEQQPWVNFFDQWRDRGYFPDRLWFDEAEIAAGRKLLMLAIALVLAGWTYRWRRWDGFLILGLVLGSCGLFVLRGIYLFDLPQFPLRILGSSLPELGSAFRGDFELNPITASALFPLLFTWLAWQKPRWRNWAIGLSLGVGTDLLVNGILNPSLMWIEYRWLEHGFLLLNTLICYGLVKITLPVGSAAWYRQVTQRKLRRSTLQAQIAAIPNSGQPPAGMRSKSKRGKSVKGKNQIGKKGNSIDRRSEQAIPSQETSTPIPTPTSAPTQAAEQTPEQPPEQTPASPPATTPAPIAASPPSASLAPESPTTVDRDPSTSGVEPLEKADKTSRD
ncbi:MAG: S8 family serine peptidase [Synechococcales bacterium]|nr:S8 family serine peptidase [Synechococcales bacterium]